MNDTMTRLTPAPAALAVLDPTPAPVDEAVLRAEATQRRIAHRLILPLLDSLGYRCGGAAVLCAGCRGGADVDFLRAAGYDAWGVEAVPPPGRWEARLARERLIAADLLSLPWPDDTFDLIVALRVLERIGPAGRPALLRSLLRVTRPGGHILLGGPNRRFPLDLFDEGRAGGVRCHAPWDRSLLSYGDQARLARATGLVASVRPLAVRGLLAGDEARRAPLGALVAWLSGELPPAVYGSWLCCFTLALVRRAALGRIADGVA